MVRAVCRLWRLPTPLPLPNLCRCGAAPGYELRVLLVNLTWHHGGWGEKTQNPGKVEGTRIDSITQVAVMVG